MCVSELCEPRRYASPPADAKGRIGVEEHVAHEQHLIDVDARPEKQRDEHAQDDHNSGVGAKRGQTTHHLLYIGISDASVAKKRAGTRLR